MIAIGSGSNVDITEPRIRQIRTVSLDGYVSGEYELFVTLRGRRNKKLTQQYREFSVRWTQKALLRHEYKKAIEQIALIANSEEIRTLEEVTGYEDRVAAFGQFWRARDPVPETPENEAKREFYRRIRVANSLFSFLYREGWRTDRGRIYVKYGEPDQIDDFPLVPDRQPYQVWHYYKQHQYRRFTFIDDTDDGDYRLAYPYDGTGMRPDF